MVLFFVFLDSCYTSSSIFSYSLEPNVTGSPGLTGPFRADSIPAKTLAHARRVLLTNGEPKTDRQTDPRKLNWKKKRKTETVLLLSGSENKARVLWRGRRKSKLWSLEREGTRRHREKVPQREIERGTERGSLASPYKDRVGARVSNALTKVRITCHGCNGCFLHSSFFFSFMN